MKDKRLVVFGYSGSIHVKKWVRSLAERGYNIRVISLGGDEISGIDIVRFKRQGKLSYFRHSAKAVRAAMEFKPDIIHVHYAGGYGIWGVRTKFHPLALSVWGSDVETLPKSFFYRRFIKSVLHNADIITATSASLKKSTINVLESTVSKTKVIPFGVMIPEKLSEFPEAEQISALYLKHLKSIYAPDILIQATAIVIKKYPSFKLTMCGDGSLKDELHNLVKQLEVETNIVFEGAVDHSKVYSLIQQHHFMVMPSLQEGFGVAAVEAFACSRAVVATNVGGIPEIVTDKQNGLLVEPNNIEALADAMGKIC